MFDESHVWALIGWLECERYEKEHSPCGTQPYAAGYLDALDAVHERLRKAFIDAPPEGMVRLPDGSGCFVAEVGDDG